MDLNVSQSKGNPTQPPTAQTKKKYKYILASKQEASCENVNRWVSAI